METSLWKIFDNVNSWLKYAEGKNAYILTFIGAQITLIKFLKCPMNGWMTTGLIFLGICFFFCLFSFFPKTVITSWFYNLSNSNEPPDEKDNLLFYGHIVKYSIEQYIEKMQKYLNGQIKGNKYLEDLCAQVVINAGITNAKFNLFKINLWMMFTGQIFFIISLIG